MFELILICYLSVGAELTNFGEWSLKSVQGLNRGAKVEIQREVEDGYTLKIPAWCQVVVPDQTVGSDWMSLDLHDGSGAILLR